MLATTRSFRTNRDYQAIHWDARATHVTSGDWELTLARDPKPQKVCQIRGVVHRPVEYLGSLRAVLFTPASFELFASPAGRRLWLDTILAQHNRASAHRLLQYRQIIRQRNALLRAIAQHRAVAAELAVWNTTLATVAAELTRDRATLLAALTPNIQAHFLALAAGADETRLGLTYRPSGPADAVKFLGQLAELQERELALQATLLGPHRDDVLLTLGDHPAEEHASRGQLRRILLALKWAELDQLGADDTPILLLLDDVFSELDADHRTALAEMTRAAQTVITTTDLGALNPQLITGATIVTLESAREA